MGILKLGENCLVGRWLTRHLHPARDLEGDDSGRVGRGGPGPRVEAVLLYLLLYLATRLEGLELERGRWCRSFQTWSRN